MKKQKAVPGYFHLPNFKGVYQKDYDEILLAQTKEMEPRILHASFVAYFEWCEENPISVTDTAAFKGELNEDVVQKIRPFTLGGMCAFACITLHRFKVIKEGGGDASMVCEWAEQIISEQKYAGAATGFFNASVIMKDLGMDKSTLTLDGSVNAVAVPSEELRRIAADLRGKL